MFDYIKGTITIVNSNYTVHTYGQAYNITTDDIYLYGIRYDINEYSKNYICKVNFTDSSVKIQDAYGAGGGIFYIILGQ